MASVYALPVSSSSQARAASRSSLKKRKRTTPDSHIAISSEASRFDEASEPEEYAAVLTPDERSQRRLAGHSLVKELPIHPFPHRAPHPPRNNFAEAVETEARHDITDERNDELASLRLQHLSAMSAVMHKCLLEKDYARARRALGLLLRTEIHGTPIDIRAASNWGIGAEILFRQYDQQSGPSQAIKPRHERRRRGFAEAKDLYEMLIVQHPFHRSRPESVNAIDFYLAMFSLWIYVAQAEGQERSNDISPTESRMLDVSDRTEVTMQELQQANEIGARMDKCMAAAPYIDNRDLLRLRAMVAEWQADLSDEIEDTAGDAVVNPENEAHVDRSAAQSLNLGGSDAAAQHRPSASTRAREKANKIYERIGRPASFTD